MANGSCMARCKQCGLYKTHLTKWHATWSANTYNVALPMDHLYVNYEAVLTSVPKIPGTPQYSLGTNLP